MGGCLVWVIRGLTNTIVDCISGRAGTYVGIAVMVSIYHIVTRPLT